MKEALVTGGTGFIGAHLVKHLADNGYRVTCLIRENSRIDRVKAPGVEFEQVSLDDIEGLKKVLKNKNYIFHLAAVINVSEKDEYYRVNYQGTENIAKAAAEIEGIERFVYISSIAASGPSKKGYLKTEDDPCNPINDYGISKLKGEKAIMEILDRSGTPYTILRPPNVIGPGQKELTQVIKIIKQGIKPLLGNGDRQTSLINVKDLARAILIAAESTKTVNKIYFVTDGNTYSWREIADLIQSELHKKYTIPISHPVILAISLFLLLFSYITKRPSGLHPKRIMDVRNNYYTYSTAKFIEDTGFTIRYSIADAVKETIRELY